MKRKTMVFALLFAVLCAAFAPFADGAAENKRIKAVFGSTKYTLDGIPLEKESIVYDGVAYLPAAYIARQLGLAANWNSATNVTNLSVRPTAPRILQDAEMPAGKGVEKVINVTFGATKYSLNGTPLDIVSMTYNNEAYLPASFLARQLGLTATWNSATNVTALKSAAPPALSLKNPVIYDCGNYGVSISDAVESGEFRVLSGEVKYVFDGRNGFGFAPQGIKDYERCLYVKFDIAGVSGGLTAAYAETLIKEARFTLYGGQRTGVLSPTSLTDGKVILFFMEVPAMPGGVGYRLDAKISYNGLEYNAKFASK